VLSTMTISRLRQSTARIAQRRRWMVSDIGCSLRGRGVL
jgi:hypothetical protein